ncbi:hypothetical protein VTO73DRAFT_14590 [Trametes versicolor]
MGVCMPKGERRQVPRILLGRVCSVDAGRRRRSADRRRTSLSLLYVVARPTASALSLPALSVPFPPLVSAGAVMLEPLAATVLTSVLPYRPFATHFLASRSAVGMAVRNAKPALPHDFFTPHPSGVKGKGRALPEDEHGLCSSNIDEEECRSSAVFRGLERAAPSSPRTLSTRQRTRRTPGHKCLASGSGTHVPSMRTWSRQVHIAQRRHASNQPAATLSEHPGAAPHQVQAWLKTYEDVSQGSQTVTPEDAWQAYESLTRSGGTRTPTSADLAFLANIALSITRAHPDDLSTDILKHWGKRLRDVLHHIDPGIGNMPNNVVKVRWNALLAVASGMLGEIDEAADTLASLYRQQPTNPDFKQTLRSQLLEAYTVFLPTIYLYLGPHAVAGSLVEHPWLQEYLTGPPRRILRFEAAENFVRVAISLLSHIENPAPYLEESSAVLTKSQSTSLGILLIRATSQAGRDPSPILQALDRKSVILPPWSVFTVVKELARAGSFDAALNLLNPFAEEESTAKYGKGQRRAYHATALFVAARQGDIETADHHWNLLAQAGGAGSDDKATYMHAYAVTGNPERVVELFDELFPPAVKLGQAQYRPNIVHYTTVIFAFSQVGDLDGVNHWLGELSRAGFHPDLHVYSIILQSFASRGDAESMTSLLDQMRESGVALTAVLYTTLITTLADRQDPVAAERVYKRAMSEGIAPDRKMITSVMNAHVEAGSWQGVIRAFDYLNTVGRPGAAVTIEVLNTLMKAYVLIGAPFRIVANVFRQLEAANARPDGRTFALLIQSACDSGFMDIAEDLFLEMERLATEEGQIALRPNIYVLTILLRGYLLSGRRLKAKEVLDRIKARGIQPTAITYGSILKAYGGQNIAAGTTVAEEFLQSLISKDDGRPWLQLERGRRLALELVYRPLLNAYVTRENAFDTERIHREMTEAGGEPTLGTLTALLDVHRRTGNIEGVKTIWPEIHRLGIEYARLNSLLSLEEPSPPNLSGHGIVLCIPVSIYIDALSVAGDHAGVAQMWKTLKDEGLQFDSHNWNHLVAALVRAGEPHRAFDVVENVILRYQAQIRREYGREREVRPTSPLKLDLPPPEEGDLPPPRSEAPLHSAAKRTSAAERATKQLQHRQGLEDGRGSEDFAHPLHVLQQLSPLWNTWRPHGATLTLLGRVLDHLRAGKLVQPVQPGLDAHFAQAALDAEEIRRRTEAAGQVLGGIYDAFPRTVQLIREYEIMKRTAQRGTTDDSF